ncbi:MAG: TldD/PmbA family protein [Pseudomonadota bacterium]
MANSLEDLAQKALSLATAAGASAADVIAVEGTSLSVDVRNGKLEQAERSEGIELGLRAFIGHRQAIVSVSNTSDETLQTMVERAVAMAQEAPEDPFIGLADAAQLATDTSSDALELFDASPEPSPDMLQSDATTAEAAALASGAVTQVQSASAGYSARNIHIAATNGFSAGYQRSGRSVSCVAIAGEGLGMERDYDGDSRTFQSDLRDPSDIGETAALRAAERLQPRKPPTGRFPVVFDERISSSLIGHLLSAANGSAISRGSSWLLDKACAQVLPAGLDVFEDPHRPRVAASRAFDAEGLPTQTRKIIDNGVLTGWSLDLVNARKLDLNPTGSAARGVSSAPSPSYWNVALTQGALDRASLLREMGTGLLVTSMIGSTINPNTGDYSRGAAGLWVENGEITHPVNECTIAGNLLEMLASLVPANDARTHLSRVVPSLLVEGMTLAGA